LGEVQVARRLLDMFAARDGEENAQLIEGHAV
jgi:hypothetical protein